MSEYFTPGGELAAFLYGFFLVLIGDLCMGKIKSVKEAAPGVRFLLSAAFACSVAIAKELLFFFLDFFTGSALQGFSAKISEKLLFFSVFGTGAGNEGQSSLYMMNIGLFYMLIGCAVCGAAILFFRSRKRGKKVDGQ